MKFLKWLGGILFILIVIYFLGPKPSLPKLSTDLPVIPSDPDSLEQYISQHEAAHKLKPGNAARIIWANDSLKQKTEYAIVYLHGFSASEEEGDPVHLDLAKLFGCNMYLSRLDAHGIDTTEPLASFTADGCWNTAVEAYAIGKQLGKKVILLSTSTGGTLALQLCADYPEIAANMMLSPNIAINDPSAWMLNNHWGLQIAYLVVGHHRIIKDTSALYARYWYTRYSTRSLPELEELIESTMKESTFKKVHQPVLLLYYYKDDKHQDPVVKVSAMKRMFLQLATPGNLKREMAIPNAGNHVIGSYIKSKDYKSVEDQCVIFMQQVLGLYPVKGNKE
jgi:pimeloyl-ACP methyl ester carboxylesterase